MGTLALPSLADDNTATAEEGDIPALSEAVQEGTGNGDYLIEEGRVDNHTTDNDGQAYNRRGREYAALDAKALAEHGKNTANATGAKLVSIAIPKIMSGIPKLVWEGTIQLGYARKEFAQANADKVVEDKNKAQRDQLTADANQGGKQATAISQENGLRDQLSQTMGGLLTQNGVNADNFVNDLLGGAFKSDEAMLKAMGVKEVERPADAEEPTPVKKEDVRSGSLTITRPDDPEGRGPGNGDQKVARRAEDGRQITGTGPGSETAARGSGMNLAGARRNEDGDVGADSRMTGEQRAASVRGAVPLRSPVSLLASVELRKVGILPGRGGKFVFHLARHNYRSFAKYRSSKVK